MKKKNKEDSSIARNTIFLHGHWTMDNVRQKISSNHCLGGAAKVWGYGYILWLNGCERHIMAAILVTALFKPIDITIIHMIQIEIDQYFRY